MNDQLNSQCAKYFSFKGVMVGAVVAFGLMFLFTLLTLGGGLASYTKTDQGLQTLIFISYLWIIVGSFFVFYIAGLVSSWVAYPTSNCDHRNSILNGFVTWVLYVMISLIFLSGASDTTIAIYPQTFITNTASTVQHEAQKIGLATLAAFFIFFVQVIGSCFGAWCGMECRRCHSECKK
jgi:uncharacterized membrane protein YoaT (DUF817 family)